MTDVTTTTTTTTTNHRYHNQRRLLDQLYATDAVLSFSFGILSLLTPHVFLAQLATGGSYNHSVHETLRYVLVVTTGTCFCRYISYCTCRLTQNQQ
jgi:hypothetical protein